MKKLSHGSCIFEMFSKQALFLTDLLPHAQQFHTVQRLSQNCIDWSIKHRWVSVQISPNVPGIWQRCAMKCLCLTVHLIAVRSVQAYSFIHPSPKSCVVGRSLWICRPVILQYWLGLRCSYFKTRLSWVEVNCTQLKTNKCCGFNTCNYRLHRN